MERLDNTIGFFENLGLGGKYLFSASLGIAASIPLAPLERLKGLFINESYTFLVIAILVFINLLLGVGKHIKLKTFDPTDMMLGWLEKLAVSYAAVGTALLVSSLKGADKFNIGSMFIIASVMSVVIYLAFSSASSMYVITNGKYPPKKWLTKLKKYNEEGADTLLKDTK